MIRHSLATSIKVFIFNVITKDCEHKLLTICKSIY